MQIKEAFFLGLGAGAVRGYFASAPTTNIKSRKQYKEWEDEENAVALRETIIATLGALVFQANKLCNPGYFPGTCQFAWGYAAVTGLRWATKL